MEIVGIPAGGGGEFGARDAVVSDSEAIKKLRECSLGSHLPLAWERGGYCSGGGEGGEGGKVMRFGVRRWWGECGGLGRGGERKRGIGLRGREAREREQG